MPYIVLLTADIHSRQAASWWEVTFSSQPLLV